LIADNTLSTLASIGAAVILLTLPLDLFFQQIVAYPTVWTVTNQTANLARSTYYTNAAVASDFTRDRATLYQDLPLYAIMQSYLIQNAMNTSLFSPCPTSNCTWPQFETLGFCSSCADVSPMLQQNCLPSSNDWVPWNVPAPDPTNTTDTSTCGYFLQVPGSDNPPLLMSGYEVNPDNSMGSLLAGRHIPLNNPIGQSYMIPDGSISFKNLQNPIIDFLISTTPNGLQGVTSKTKPLVQECAVSWCVKTIQAHYDFGVLNEKVVNTQQLNTNNVQDPWLIESRTYQPYFSLNRPDPHAPGGQTTYGASNQTTRSIIQSFQDFIWASWSSENNQTSTSMEVKFAEWYYQYDQSPPQQFAVMQTPWNNANISAKMDELAASMTNIIRQYPVNNTESFPAISGTAYTAEVHVQLRLEWAALPGGLLLFSLIFLLSTVWRTTDADKVGVWKTSALAVLFNGIGDDIQATLGSKVKTGDARKRAKDMVVQLDDE
jgi:hypothetical protein